MALAKETLPISNPTIEGVEIVFAGQKLWSRLTSDDGVDKVQVALAATDFGLELYDLLVRFYPPLTVAEPYRTIAGLVVNGTDATYAAFFTKE